MKLAVMAFLAFAAVGVSRGAVAVKDGETVAFLGDSITQQGQDPRNPNGYVNLVARGLASEGVNVKVVRAGISGHKSNDMLARLEKDVLSKKPDWMTLSCGVNDVWHQDRNRGVLLEDYKKNIAAILDKCAAANCRVIVLTATPFTHDPADGGKNAKLAPYNQWLREEAARRGLPVADLNAQMWEILKADPKAPLTRDGVHMQTAGNRAMSKGVLKAMGVAEDAFAKIEREAWKDVWVICRFDLKAAENRAAYIAETKKIINLVRAEPGCLTYTLLGDAETSWDAPQRSGEKTLWMIEHWDSVQSLQAHLQTPHMKMFAPAAQPLRAGGTFQVLEAVAD